jgi:hypothetical protein
MEYLNSSWWILKSYYLLGMGEIPDVSLGEALSDGLEPRLTMEMLIYLRAR